MAYLPQNTYIPAQATAGLNFLAKVDLTTYPAPDWVLSLHLRGPKTINLVADEERQFMADATTTGDWAAGSYWYTLRASKGADAVEIEAGQMSVLPDLLTQADGYDGRSNAQIALDAIDAVLAKRATLDQERYRINNRELYRTPIADLLKLRSYYASIVKREAASKSGRSRFGRQVLVRFS